MKDRRGRYDERRGERRERGRPEISLAAANCRKMNGAPGPLLGGHVQVAAAAKPDRIVTAEGVPAANDRGQLRALAGAAPAEVAVEKLQAVADKGCHAADQLEAGAPAGREPFVPAPGGPSGRGKDGQEVFPKERLPCAAASDPDPCPGGHRLKRGRESQSRGKARIVDDPRAAGAPGARKPQGPRGAYRGSARRTNEAVVARAAGRAAAPPEKIAARKEIVAHVFGPLRPWGHAPCLRRGLAKVRAAFSLSALACNLRRALNLVSVADQLKALGLAVNRAAPSPA